MDFWISNFHSIRPNYESSQEATLAWAAAAHAFAKAKKEQKQLDDPAIIHFKDSLHKILLKIGAGPGKIAKRGTHSKDFTHTEWDQMNLVIPTATIGERHAYFGQEIEKIFTHFYPPQSTLPSNLIHVTCTGYLSPSGAQKLVAERGLGGTTMVTHAYHMGCYASIPALRIAQGFTALSQTATDIVHTEMCSLHMNTESSDLEQLVVQTLFADGFIKYSLVSSLPAQPALKVTALHEFTLTGTSDAMTWSPEQWGLRMSLKREVPQQIGASIHQALALLAQKGRTSLDHLLQHSYFAIHPGGPKIIDHLQKILGLKEWQIAHSRCTLSQYGNMSSATLPHIWESILNDEEVSSRSLIVSVAFGPGLNIASGLLEKCNIR